MKLPEKLLTLRKRSGLSQEALAEKLGLAREEIAAVGDGLNDLELLEYAGIGAAMGNGVPELKQAADRVLPPVEEDGLAKFVQELLV